MRKGHGDTKAEQGCACCKEHWECGLILFPLLQVKNKAASLGVISASEEKEPEGDGHSNARKLKAPDADTMVVKVPAHEHSGSIGPIWNDAPSTSKDSQVQQM